MTGLKLESRICHYFGCGGWDGDELLVAFHDQFGVEFPFTRPNSRTFFVTAGSEAARTEDILAKGLRYRLIAESQLQATPAHFRSFSWMAQSPY
jgi:hypothetical protein